MCGDNYRRVLMTRLATARRAPNIANSRFIEAGDKRLVFEICLAQPVAVLLESLQHEDALANTHSDTEI